MVPRVNLLLLPLLAGCGDLQRKTADFQLDVYGATWTDTDRVRVCVEGHAVFEAALGHGRIAVGALPPESALSASVDLLEGETSIGGVGPIELSDDRPHAQLEWEPCIEGDCAPCTSGAQRDSGHHSGHDSVLAIRFFES